MITPGDCECDTLSQIKGRMSQAQWEAKPTTEARRHGERQDR